MKALLASLAILLVFTVALHAASEPSLQDLNDACESALRRGDYPRAGSRCRDAAELAQRVAPGSLEQAEAQGQLGLLLADEGRYDEAAVLVAQATSIIETIFGRYDPMVVPALQRQALVEQLRGRFTVAERLLLRAEDILGLSSEPDEAQLAAVLQSRGLLYFDMHRYAEAERVLLRSLALLEHYYGSDDLPATMLLDLIERARAAALRPDAIAPPARD